MWGGTGGVCLDVLTTTQLSVSAFIVIALIDYTFLYALGETNEFQLESSLD